jgi:hypothetical protein
VRWIGKGSGLREKRQGIWKACGQILVGDRRLRGGTRQNAPRVDVHSNCFAKSHSPAAPVPGYLVDSLYVETNDISHISGNIDEGREGASRKDELYKAHREGCSDEMLILFRDPHQSGRAMTHQPRVQED